MRAVGSEALLGSLREQAFLYLIPAYSAIATSYQQHNVESIGMFVTFTRIFTSVYLAAFALLFLLYFLPAVSATAKDIHFKQGILLHVPRELLIADRSLRALVKQIIAADVDGDGSTIPQLPPSALKKVAAAAAEASTEAQGSAADPSAIGIFGSSLDAGSMSAAGGSALAAGSISGLSNAPAHPPADLSAPPAAAGKSVAVRTAAAIVSARAAPIQAAMSPMMPPR